MDDYTQIKKPPKTEHLCSQLNWLHQTDNLHPCCYRCLANRPKAAFDAKEDEHHAKSNETIDNYKRGDFIVNCTGIPLDYSKTIPQEIWNKWSVVDQENFLEVQDPVYWARKYLDWEPRESASLKGLDYQSVIVRCTAAREQTRLGRRCLEENTFVSMSDGSLKRIKDIKVGDSVLSMVKEGLVSRKVLSVFDNEIQSVYKITLRTGKFLILTENHRLWVKKEGVWSWMSIQDGIDLSSRVFILEEGFSSTGIFSIEKLEKKVHVYDIEVTETHNFIANGIVSHNSGKTNGLSVKVLHHAFTHMPNRITGKKAAQESQKSGNVLVVTPFGKQIDLIFKEIRMLLARNPKLQSSVVRDVHSPHEIELINGNTIIGMTAGVKSGSKAASSRGQGAGLIVFDEMDYIDNDSVQTVIVIAGENKKAKVWASSTPTGSRDSIFYLNSLSPWWTEFHFPSWVSPVWNQRVEAEFRQMFDHLTYLHEVEAEYGEQLAGVFPVEFVERACHMQTYNYGSDKQAGQIGWRPDWVYTMGVDWNQATDNQVVVTGFNPADHKAYIVDRLNISHEKFQQTVAVQKIVEMNRKWKCDHIYIDRGYGSTQYELLHTLGNTAREQIARKSKENSWAHVDARLVDIVEAIDSAHALEIFDPITKEPTKQRTKPLMVQNCMRRFENSSIVFPEHDSELKSQLLAYIILRVTPEKMPVYGSRHPEKIGDHIIDALFLSLWALTKEYSSLGGPQYEIYMNSIPGGFTNLLPTDLRTETNNQRNQETYKLSSSFSMGRSIQGRTELNQTVKRALGNLAGLVQNDSSRLPISGTRQLETGKQSTQGSFTGPRFSRGINSQAFSRKI